MKNEKTIIAAAVALQVLEQVWSSTSRVPNADDVRVKFMALEDHLLAHPEVSQVESGRLMVKRRGDGESYLYLVDVSP